MDAVGKPLSIIISQLDALQSRYEILITKPTRNLSVLDPNCLYVIRQHISADGIYQLVAAAKMKKEGS